MNYMTSRSQYSEEEIKRICIRMKSARVLSGLNQEQFANAHGISHMSLKGWEKGKALPRQLGLLKFVSALNACGIQVDTEWLLFGSGAGPTCTPRQSPKIQSERANYLEQQIALFKKEQVSMGLNPLVAEINDTAMSPQYKSGDIVGGVFVTLDIVRNNLLQRGQKGEVFLVRIDDVNFAPRQLFLAGERMFISSLEDLTLFEYSTRLIAKICWHYFPASQT